MNIIGKQLLGILFVSCLLSFFLISGSISEGTEAKEGQFKIFGVVKSATNVESFVLEEGEKFYVTRKTIFKNMENKPISFKELIQPGTTVLVLTEEVGAKLIAITVRMSGGG